MSRIAIDIRPLLDRHMTGVGFALLETLHHLLPHASPTREYLLFASGTPDVLERIPDLPKNPHVFLIKKHLPNKLVMLLSLLRTDALDTLIGEPFDAWWFPNWTRISTKKPFALTVHDLTFVHTPHFSSPQERMLVWLAQPHVLAARAARCIAVSPHTADDMRTTWNIPPSKIHVAPLGVDHDLFCVREQSSDRSYRASYDLNRPYIFSLATHEPRKNLLGILEAYQEVRLRDPATPPLVLAGVAKQHFPEHLLHHVHLLGYIPSKHRPALFRGARVFMFPSFNEGFGLPVLEALACGIPVVTSVATPPSSLFHAGIFPADPYNVLDISAALTEALHCPNDPLSREHFSLQTHAFTWQAHAQEVLAVLQRLS